MGIHQNLTDCLPSPFGSDNERARFYSVARSEISAALRNRQTTLESKIALEIGGPVQWGDFALYGDIPDVYPPGDRLPMRTLAFRYVTDLWLGGEQPERMAKTLALGVDHATPEVAAAALAGLQTALRPETRRPRRPWPIQSPSERATVQALSLILSRKLVDLPIEATRDIKQALTQVLETKNTARMRLSAR